MPPDAFEERCVRCDAPVSPERERCARCGLRYYGPSWREASLDVLLATIPWLLVLVPFLLCVYAILALLGTLGGAAFVM